MKKVFLSLYVISVLAMACEKQTGKEGADGFTELNGNAHDLKIDRVSYMPDVQFPGEDLQESDYNVISEHFQYEVAFSENGQTVTIEPGTLRGEKVSDEEGSRRYEFVEGAFAGGRLVIWRNNGHFEAEITIYGSGVPIVKSGRGNLVLAK